MSEARDPTDSTGPELVQDDEVIGRALRLSLVVLVAGAGAAGLVWWLMQGEAEAPPAQEVETRSPRTVQRTLEAPSVRFTDVTAAAGIDFVHENGAAGEKLLPETMGGGVAFLDHDDDGDADLLFVNFNRWSADSDGEPAATMALYANDGAGRFTDVTVEAGLDASFFGMGVAVADVDCDGDRDLYFTAVGANYLFLNEGGRFREVEAGVAGSPEAWSTCAAFFDADGDGDLDLYVGNYVHWSREIDFAVDYRLTGIGRAYGPPMNFGGAHPYLFRNDGAGRFTDVTAEAGLQVTNPATGEPVGKALGVVPADVDGDGRLDLVVANDTVQKFVFRNLGDGRFEEQGALCGVAFDRNGKATGAMGVDGARFRNDGALGFAVGNFANEMSSLFVSQEGAALYADEAIVEGLGAPTRKSLTFGVFFFDYDLDGRLDLLHANGHLEDEISKVQASQSYEQPAQLFWNAGSASRATFVEVLDSTLGDLSRPIVGRGASYADIDGDGDLDVVLTQTGGPPLLLRNDQELGHRWLRVRLEGEDCNRDAIGATVELTSADLTQTRLVMPTRGYLSQVEPTLTFGLGEADTIERLEVTWPDGTRQEVPGAEPGLTITVRKAR